MNKQIFWHFMVSRATWVLFFSALLCYTGKAKAETDTTKKQLLAAVEKNDNAPAVTLEANVVFPGVLTGNEEEALLYIEKFAANRRAYLIRTYNRSKKYFPKVTAVLKKHNLPEELKVLLALESAFNANAVSKAGAVGYWQIMDDVAKEYGLKYVAQQKAVKNMQRADKKKAVKKAGSKKPVTVKDDRKNFNKSTYAAARYLKDRGRNLNNDLLLMVASYNCGIGNVWSAMKKTGKDNPGFWDIKNYLPAETRAYVMNFISLNVIFHNYEKFEKHTLLFTPVTINPENTAGKKHGELSSSGILD